MYIVSYWHIFLFCGFDHWFCLIRYNELKKNEKLKQLSEKIALVQSQLQSCETRIKEISDEVTRSNELLLGQDKLKRNIEDNLNYRETKSQVDKLTYEIELHEEEVVKIGEVSKVEAELAKLSQERERLLSEVLASLTNLSVNILRRPYCVVLFFSTKILGLF